MARKFQIGVMGSAADLQYAKEVEDAAYEVGKYVAEMGGILFLAQRRIAIRSRLLRAVAPKMRAA